MRKRVADARKAGNRRSFRSRARYRLIPRAGARSSCPAKGRHSRWLRVGATFSGRGAAARTRQHCERRKARHRDGGSSRRVLSLPLGRVRTVHLVGRRRASLLWRGLVKPRGLERLRRIASRREKPRCRRHVSRGWRRRRRWIAEILIGRLAMRGPPRDSVRASIIRLVGPGGARHPS